MCSNISGVFFVFLFCFILYHDVPMQSFTQAPLEISGSGLVVILHVFLFLSSVILTDFLSIKTDTKCHFGGIKNFTEFIVI